MVVNNDFSELLLCDAQGAQRLPMQGDAIGALSCGPHQKEDALFPRCRKGALLYQQDVGKLSFYFKRAWKQSLGAKEVGNESEITSEEDERLERLAQVYLSQEAHGGFFVGTNAAPGLNAAT